MQSWRSDCAPCREALPKLRDLQQKYGRYGLQVVGVAYEKGSLTQKQDAVRPVRSRYNLNYTILFGDQGSCPLGRHNAQQKFLRMHIPAVALARFEIEFDNLDEALYEINTLMEVQAALQDASSGLLFLPWNGNLSAPWQQ